MTTFRLGMTVSCPSDWSVEQCREWAERMLSTREERESLVVTQVIEDREEEDREI